MKKVKPLFPSLFLIIAISLLLFSGKLFVSPFQRTEVIVIEIILAAVGVSFLWAIENSYLQVCYGLNEIKLKGFFTVKRHRLAYEDIEGYKTREIVDQISGFREEFFLVLKNGKEIMLPKMAYSEEDYRELRFLCEAEFEHLGSASIKYGKVIGKVLTIMFALSGIFAAFVGLIKLLN